MTQMTSGARLSHRRRLIVGILLFVLAVIATTLAWAGVSLIDLFK